MLLIHILQYITDKNLTISRQKRKAVPHELQQGFTHIMKQRAMLLRLYDIRILPYEIFNDLLAQRQIFLLILKARYPFILIQNIQLKIHPSQLINIPIQLQSDRLQRIGILRDSIHIRIITDFT